MTTTISFATRNCVVIGCDSLATSTRPMLDPFRLINDFFDPSDGFKLRRGADGEPVLQQFDQTLDALEHVPYNQLPSVTKIFHLKPADIGVLFAGAAVIGNKSIQNLIDDFLSDKEIGAYLKREYTVHGTAERFSEMIEDVYEPAFANLPRKPELEIILSGYSKRYGEPEVSKIEFDSDGRVSLDRSVKRGEFKFVFGGQYDVIQRIVLGMDFGSYVRYRDHVRALLLTYRELLMHAAAEQGLDFEIPGPDEFEDELKTADYGWVHGIQADLANFSEQAAIDYVDFLVDVMIKAQEFSSTLQTVGGNIHLAIITKSGGFRWISREEYKYRGYGVPKHA